jgi:hypothetical protein
MSRLFPHLMSPLDADCRQDMILSVRVHSCSSGLFTESLILRTGKGIVDQITNRSEFQIAQNARLNIVQMRLVFSCAIQQWKLHVSRDECQPGLHEVWQELAAL